MGKHKLFDINKYVSYNAETKTSVCLVNNCGKRLSGNRPANIKRHYKLVHKKSIGTGSDDDYSDDNVYESLTSTSRIRRTKSRVSVDINMDEKEFLKCCVGLVTVKNIPFRIFDDEEFFKKIISPYEQKFNTNVNSKNISVVVEKASQQIKEIIIKRIEKKMVSLKVDIATRMERSILGINLQYIKDYKLCVNTIGMIEISKRHTAQFLKEEILKCLQEFQISITQIYSNTTDNGANIIKASKLLQELQEENNTNIEDNYRDEEDIQSQIAAVFAVVRCAAHTMQLAAHDVLKVIEPEINECRKLVKKLRTSIRAGDININMPTLDNATRWNSTYNMINSILSQKEHIDNLEDVVIIDFDWNFVQNFVNAFRHLADCTLKFQQEQYMLGDFYRDWLCCELELAEIVSTNCYAALLHEAMATRKQKLFEHNAFVAALYLDPRFNFEGSAMLSDEQKKVAMNHLLKTYDLIKNLEEAPASEEEGVHLPSEITTDPIDIPSTSKDKYSKLSQHIRQMITKPQSNISSKRCLKQKLSMLCEQSMETLDTNILEHWKKFHRNDPELSKLALVALAVPATQVSVERAFSALSTILTKLRAKLSKKNLSNILLTKLNFDMLQSSSLSLN